MSVRNITKRTILVDNVRIAKSLKDKTVGLLLSKNPAVILLKTRFGIHTFGMRYAIDVLILDQNSKVVKLRKSLPPNYIFLWNPAFDTVLELPEGIIEKTQTKLGDKLDFH